MAEKMSERISEDMLDRRSEDIILDNKFLIFQNLEEDINMYIYIFLSLYIYIYLKNPGIYIQK